MILDLKESIKEFKQEYLQNQENLGILSNLLDQGVIFENR